MNYQTLNTEIIDPSWHTDIECALTQVDQSYLHHLEQSHDWLPGAKNIFNAFSQPQSQVHTILMGESPYPRSQSANGYAFWDAAVTELWSQKGLSTKVNRATSLRNFIKMLLVAAGDLSDDTSQGAITTIDKSNYVDTLAALFNNMLKRGFLLLNASLVLSQTKVAQEAKNWRDFIHAILQALQTQDCQLLLFGNIAKQIKPLVPAGMPCLIAEHPYNISFIHNPQILEYFAPLHLLDKEQPHD